MVWLNDVAGERHDTKQLGQTKFHESKQTYDEQTYGHRGDDAGDGEILSPLGVSEMYLS